MSEKVKLQIYVPADTARAWKERADKEGVTLSGWVCTKVLSARLLSTTLTNLHHKVDRLLLDKDS